MTDQIDTIPIWLMDVRHLQAQMDAEKRAKEAEQREKEQRAEAARRVLQLHQFTVALRHILGKQAADELLGGPDAEAKALEVESAPYWLVFEPPHGTGQNVLHRLSAKRYLPEEVALFLHGHTKAPIASGRVESLTELATVLAVIDETYEAKVAEYGPHPRRIEPETPAESESDWLASEVSEFNKSTADYLKKIADVLWAGKRAEDLNTWDALLIALAQHLMVEHE